ncbi:MAG: cell division protein FtsX [Amphiplicatus sp.]
MTQADEENGAAIAERFARGTGAEAPNAGVFRRLRAEPLIPEAGAGGAPLTAVIGVMSFLAALALAAFILISEAASVWTTDLERQITIQIKGVDAEAIAASTEAAMAVLQSTDGVIEATPTPPEEAAKLLEPWLGKGNLSAYLNVPALIQVKVSDALRRDLEVLRTRLAAAAPGAVLDDHGAWHDRLASTARSGQILAFLVFMLIMGAACAISVFAARAGLAANSEIVAILHLVGATDDFIANEVQRRFFVIGLRGAVMGLALALFALGLVALALRARTGTGVGDFLPALTLGPDLAFILLVVPISLCLVTAFTARFTVLKALAREL